MVFDTFKKSFEIGDEVIASHGKSGSGFVMEIGEIRCRLINWSVRSVTTWGASLSWLNLVKRREYKFEIGDEVESQYGKGKVLRKYCEYDPKRGFVNFYYIDDTTCEEDDLNLSSYIDSKFKFKLKEQVLVSNLEFGSVVGRFEHLITKKPLYTIQLPQIRVSVEEKYLTPNTLIYLQML